LDEDYVLFHLLKKNIHSSSLHAVHFYHIGKAYLIKYDKHPYELCHTLPYPDNSKSGTPLGTIHKPTFDEIFVTMQLCTGLDV